MDFILNIGLAVKVDGKTQTLDPDLALFVAWANGFKVVDVALLQSDSEPTVVARAHYIGSPRVEAAAAQLATTLAQDCIAVYNLTLDRGFLAGPQASAWGEFDPRFFILLDGTRLANLTLPSAA